jgi:tRNA 2-thiouridine synthesizing protein E
MDITRTINKKTDPDFPHAPDGWNQDEARKIATEEGLEPEEAHWDAVRALQEYFARHEEGTAIKSRELHDALDEKFHAQGGLKYLYKLFPGGPVSQ